MSLCLSGCATQSEIVDLSPFLQPCVIEGNHHSLVEVADDPTSTTRDLIDFGGAAEDAVNRCNEDKASMRRLTEEAKK